MNNNKFILSWDIGMKNLAYCLMDNNKQIYKWSIIDVMPNIHNCYHFKCYNEVIHQILFLNVNIYSCSKHNPFDKLKKYDNNVSIKKYNVINCNNINIDLLRENVIRSLNLDILFLCYFYKINYVLIENQPAMKNPKMKAIMDIIYSWFLIKCKIDCSIIDEIKLINPSNKLKKYLIELKDKDKDNDVDKIKNDKKKYKETKNKSIEVVESYLNKSTDNNRQFLYNLWTSKKKDDLCDCLLQAHYWIDNYL